MNIYYYTHVQDYINLECNSTYGFMRNPTWVFNKESNKFTLKLLVPGYEKEQLCAELNKEFITISVLDKDKGEVDRAVVRLPPEINKDTINMVLNPYGVLIISVDSSKPAPKKLMIS